MTSIFNFPSRSFTPKLFLSRMFYVISVDSNLILEHYQKLKSTTTVTNSECWRQLVLSCSQSLAEPLQVLLFEVLRQPIFLIKYSQNYINSWIIWKKGRKIRLSLMTLELGNSFVMTIKKKLSFFVPFSCVVLYWYEIL